MRRRRLHLALLTIAACAGAPLQAGTPSPAKACVGPYLESSALARQDTARSIQADRVGLDKAAQRHQEKGLNTRSLNDTDFEQLLDACVEGNAQKGINRDGNNDSSLGNYIGYNSESRWIATTQLPPEFIANIGGNGARAITFRVGEVQGYQDIDACRDAVRGLGDSRRESYVDQQYHTAVKGLIPLRAVDRVIINGRVFRPAELLGRVKLGTIALNNGDGTARLFSRDYRTTAVVALSALAHENPALAKALHDSPAGHQLEDVAVYYLDQGDDAGVPVYARDRFE